MPALLERSQLLSGRRRRTGRLAWDVAEAGMLRPQQLLALVSRSDVAIDSVLRRPRRTNHPLRVRYLAASPVHAKGSEEHWVQLVAFVDSEDETWFGGELVTPEAVRPLISSRSLDEVREQLLEQRETLLEMGFTPDLDTLPYFSIELEPGQLLERLAIRLRGVGVEW